MPSFRRSAITAHHRQMARTLALNLDLAMCASTPTRSSDVTQLARCLPKTRLCLRCLEGRPPSLESGSFGASPEPGRLRPGVGLRSPFFLAGAKLQ